MKHLVHTIGLSALLVLLNVAPAHAVTGDFTIYPSYMHGDNKSWILLDLKQGEAVTDYVTVENLTDKPQTIKLEIQEAATENGTFLLKENKEPRDLGKWTQLQQNSLELQPHEKTKIPVKIVIPGHADMTTYQASILASQSEKNGQNIVVTTRIGVRMYVDVHRPGALQTNIFNSPFSSSTAFFLLSLMGVIGALLYNIIHYTEQRKYAKKQA